MLAFIILGALATHRLVVLLNQDVITARVRERILDRWPPHDGSLTYILTCPWCMSIWTGALVTGAYALAVGGISWWLAIAAVLAFSSVTGLIEEKR